MCDRDRDRDREWFCIVPGYDVIIKIEIKYKYKKNISHTKMATPRRVR